jgi:hypothetical protein
MKAPRTAPTAALFALALGAATAGCFGNPVNDEIVASLGGEDPSVPPGPLHRPGQPCLACHSSDGPAQLQLATGGTVFQDAMNVFPNALPAAGVTVTFTDANRVVSEVLSNCAGNFYVTHADWVGAGYAFPVHVDIGWTPPGQPPDQAVTDTMISHMGKETSCASCHIWAVPAMNGSPAMAPAPSATSVGQIYLSFAPLTAPTPTCPMGTNQ